MKRLLIITLAVMALMPLSARAVQTDAMIEGAKLCTRHLPHYEREYAIPTHLLSAIASTESGRFHEGLGMKLPWPWAINAQGKGYYFDSKEEAINAVKKLRAQGISSIDVGCMQINLIHHPEAFSSLNEAFEPENNIAYAANFLHNLYGESNSWKKAAGDYHSRTPSLGAEYIGLVYNSWFTIIEKLRAARLHVHENSLTAMNELKSNGNNVAVSRPAPVNITRSAPKTIHISADQPSAAQPKRLIEQQEQQVAAYQSPRMNSIQISSRNPEPEANLAGASSNMIVMKSDLVPSAGGIQPSQAVASDNMPILAAAPQPITGNDYSAHRMPPVAVPNPKSGPNFIFQD